MIHVVPFISPPFSGLTVKDLQWIISEIVHNFDDFFGVHGVVIVWVDEHHKLAINLTPREIKHPHTWVKAYKLRLSSFLSSFSSSI